VGGELISIDFEEGAFVKEGQQLMHIDDRKYVAHLRSAEAELARTQAQLAIDEIQLERSQSLMHKDYISKQEFETYTTRVEQDKANVTAAKAKIVLAEVDLEHCSIKSPISGFIGKRLVDRGAVVNPMQRLVTVCQISPMSVDFFVSENDFPQLNQAFQKQGQLNLEMTLIAHKDTRAKGILKFLDNKIDHESGVIHLRGMFENADYQFWPGNSVRVNIELNMLKDALLIPSESIKVNPLGKFYVYQVKFDETSKTKHKAVQIFPEIGFRNESLSVVRSGLQVNDKVILRGNMLLGSGSDVIPMPDMTSGKNMQGPSVSSQSTSPGTQ
jgi:RND family efflux transporter MFP subunit